MARVCVVQQQCCVDEVRCRLPPGRQAGTSSKSRQDLHYTLSNPSASQQLLGKILNERGIERTQGCQCEVSAAAKRHSEETAEGTKAEQKAMSKPAQSTRAMPSARRKRK